MAEKCIYCGRVMEFAEARIPGGALYHPDFGQDCYFLVTVLGRRP